MKKLIYTSAFILSVSFIFPGNFQNTYGQWERCENGIGTGSTFVTFTSNGNTIFAGGYDGLYKSTNNGLNWTLTTLGSYSVRALASKGDTILAGLPSSNGLRRSLDNGVTWLLTSLGNKSVNAILIVNNIIFLGDDDYGVYKSHDYGFSWGFVGNFNATVYSLGFNDGKLFAGLYDKLMYSLDYGLSWQQSSLINKKINSICSFGNILFAGVRTDGVYKSTNNGISWNQTSFNSGTVQCMATSLAFIFAGTTSPGVYMSLNDGDTWELKNEGFPGNRDIMALCTHNGYLFSGHYYGGVWRRLVSSFIGIKLISTEIPEKYSLSQNYPNPFNPVTKIKFDIPKSAYTELKIYDNLGREIYTLVSQEITAGKYEVEWTASNHPSGVYYYKLVTGDYTETKKMILMK